MIQRIENHKIMKYLTQISFFMFVFFIILHKRRGADYSVINPLFLVYFFNSLLFEGPESLTDFQGFFVLSEESFSIFKFTQDFLF